MPKPLRQWTRSRVGQWAMTGFIAYILWVWYEDLGSGSTEAWIESHGGHGSYATVFIMGLALGCLVGVACGPVLLSAFRARLPRQP